MGGGIIDIIDCGPFNLALCYLCGQNDFLEIGHLSRQSVDTVPCLHSGALRLSCLRCLRTMDK